jgi:hypothetical protein
MSSDGPWTELMVQSLEDSREQASPPVQRFELGQEAEVRFIKFEMLDFWGSMGGGLQYFAPFTAGNLLLLLLLIFLLLLLIGIWTAMHLKPLYLFILPFKKLVPPKHMCIAVQGV